MAAEQTLKGSQPLAAYGKARGLTGVLGRKGGDPGQLWACSSVRPSQPAIKGTLFVL